MAGQTYDPYEVFADAPAPTPDLSHIPTAQLQALLDARRASEAASSALGAVPGKAGLFDDLIPQGSAGQPRPAGASDGNWWSASPVVQPAAGAPQRDPWAAFPIVQPAPSPAAADPWAAFADAPAAPVDHSTLTVPVGQPDPGVLQHMWNAASRVPGNLLGKIEAINPHDIIQTVDSMAAGIPYSDRISAAAAAATGIGGQFGDYAGNLAADRAATAARMQADPSREMVGQFAGSALLPIGAAGNAMKGATLGAIEIQRVRDLMSMLPDTTEVCQRVDG